MSGSLRSVSVEYERDKEASAVFGSDDIESRRDWAHGDFYESDVVFLSEMVDRRSYQISPRNLSRMESKLCGQYKLVVTRMSRSAIQITL